MGRGVMQVLWPSFLMATAASGVFFSLFDPQQLELFGVVIPPDRLMAYTIGFIAFWLLCAGSSAMTYMLSREAHVNASGAAVDVGGVPHASVHTTTMRRP